MDMNSNKTGAKRTVRRLALFALMFYVGIYVVTYWNSHS